MFRLAAAWAARNEGVLCTTTTKIRPPSRDQCPEVRLAEFPALVADLRRRPAPFVTAARRIEGGKCLGFPPDEALLLAAHARHLIVEADGSVGRPVKAHAAFEPVIAPKATCVVAVVGGWCVGAPLDADHVHRPGIFSALSGREPGAAVTADDVARVILHEEGWLREVPAGAAFHVVVTGTDGGIARALALHPNAGRILAVHAGTMSAL